MIKIRLQGNLEDVEAVTQILKSSLQILEESEDCQIDEEVPFIKRYLTFQKSQEALELNGNERTIEPSYEG